MEQGTTTESASTNTQGTSKPYNDFNKVEIVGRLGGDPQLRYTPKGTPVLTVNVANHEEWMEQNEKKRHTNWVTVVQFGPKAEISAQLTKGTRVRVAGKLKMRSWETEGGKTNSKLEIVAFEIEAQTRAAAPAASAAEPSSEEPSHEMSGGEPEPDFFSK